MCCPHLQTFQGQCAFLCNVLRVQATNYNAITLHIIANLSRDHKRVSKLKLFQRTCSHMYATIGVRQREKWVRGSLHDGGGMCADTVRPIMISAASPFDPAERV